MNGVTKEYFWQWDTFKESLSHALDMIPIGRHNRGPETGFVVIAKEEQWDTWYHAFYSCPEDMQAGHGKLNIVAKFSQFEVQAEQPLIYIPEQKTRVDKVKEFFKQVWL